MTKQRYNKLDAYASRSIELIDYDEYINNYQWTSDIQGENVDIVIYDDGYDIMHYEYRDNIQLVDWGYLIDNPTCTYEEWRAQDVTYEELNTTIKGYFQEVLDDWASQDGIPFDSSRVWSPAALHNFSWGSEYNNMLFRDDKKKRLGVYYNLVLGHHGTGCLSNIVGKTCGLAKKSPVYLISHSWARSMGFNYIELPTLLAQCKVRSGITRPTVRSMSMTFNGAQKTTDSVIKAGAISQSNQTIGPLGGVLNITIPEKVSSFCELYNQNTIKSPNTPDEEQPSGVLYFTGSLNYSEDLIAEVKRQNDVIDYVEQTFQLVPRARRRQTYTTRTHTPRYKLITTNEAFKTPDQQPYKELFDTFYNSNGHTIRSAGNSSEIWTSYEDMVAVQQRHIKEHLGGLVETQQWDTGSIIELGDTTLQEVSLLAESNGTIYGIQGTNPYNFYTSSEFATSGNTIEEKGVAGHFSGSNVSLQELGLEHPYVWRVRPIFSNLTATQEWNSSGKSFETFSTGSQVFKNIFLTGSNGYYTPDLDIIRNDEDFIAAGGTIITGSVEDGTLPAILDMVTEAFDEGQEPGIEFNQKYDLYQHNGAYHVEQFQFGERLQNEHPSRTAIYFYLNILLNPQLVPSNIESPTPNQSFDGLGNIVGVLWEPYDISDNLIMDKPLVAVIPLKSSAWSKFLLIDRNDGDNFKISGDRANVNNLAATSLHMDGNDFDNRARWVDGFTYHTLYFSGSLDTDSSIDFSGVQKFNNKVNYIFNEDTDDLYTKIQNSTIGEGYFDVNLNDVPITEWYLSNRPSHDNYIVLLKESPTLGRELRVVTQSYSPIKLGGWAHEQDLDERGMLAMSTAYNHQIDPYRPHELSQSLHFPSTNITSSYTTGYKHFHINPTSSTTHFLTPEDAVANHTCRGSRVTIGTPGRNVNVAGAWHAKDGVGRTLVDFFNTGSVYYKLPFHLASCSFDNMRTSTGDSIPQLGFMTGSQPTSSDNWITRECVNFSHYETYYVDDTGRVNAYAYNSGTSFACPLLAGLSALWLDLYPNLSQFELRDLLRATGYRGFLRDEPITGDKKGSTINDFHSWMFGATNRYPNYDSSLQLQPSNFSGSNVGMRQYIYDSTTSTTAYNKYHSELLLRKHLTTYTTNYSLSNLMGSPNIIGRWPYSQTNRADLTGSFTDLLFSGSVTINNG